MIATAATPLRTAATVADLPIVSRAAHYARADNGTPAAGIYAFVAPGMDADMWIVDVRDTTDQQITFARHCNASAAIAAAVQLGATFVVDEF